MLFFFLFIASNFIPKDVNKEKMKNKKQKEENVKGTILASDNAFPSHTFWYEYRKKKLIKTKALKQLSLLFK